MPLGTIRMEVGTPRRAGEVEVGGTQKKLQKLQKEKTKEKEKNSSRSWPELPRMALLP